MPLYRVVRVGGPSDANNPRFDLPTVTLDSFGADRSAATNAAIDADEALRLTLPGTTTGGATVTRVETVTGPHWSPWDDTNVRRMTSTYRLHVKRHATGYTGIETLLVAWLETQLGERVVTDVPNNLADIV